MKVNWVRFTSFCVKFFTEKINIGIWYTNKLINMNYLIAFCVTETIYDSINFVTEIESYRNDTMVEP